MRIDIVNPHFFVIPERFERSTHALEGRCSIQLSYGTNLFTICGAKIAFLFVIANKSAIFFKMFWLCM